MHVTNGARKSAEGFSQVITGVCICLAIALVYVWFHVNMTKLNYEVAKEIAVRDSLNEESKRLRMELETLKSPHRIETIANSKLKMSYPERDQVIFLYD